MNIMACDDCTIEIYFYFSRLKNEYKSTDERTNLGFIVSPLCTKQQDSLCVKIVVHSSYTTEPFSFTCDGKCEIFRFEINPCTQISF